MKLDTGSKLILAVVLALPGYFWIAGMVGFWCLFTVIYDAFKEKS